MSGFRVRIPTVALNICGCGVNGNMQRFQRLVAGSSPVIRTKPISYSGNYGCFVNSLRQFESDSRLQEESGPEGPLFF
jgi:hypothetical protein